MIDWEKLKNDYSLEDWYNILYRNEPSKKAKIHNDWSILESITYEELLEENERPNECIYLINKIIIFLKKQKKMKGL